MQNHIFVDKFYFHDPEIEDYLPGGEHLKNGMRVLLAGFENRVLTTDWMTEAQYDRAKEVNRWCRVMDVQVTEGVVYFVGAYEDGTMRLRYHSINTPWLVKLDSIDEPFDIREGYSKGTPSWENTVEDKTLGMMF